MGVLMLRVVPNRAGDVMVAGKGPIDDALDEFEDWYRFARGTYFVRHGDADEVVSAVQPYSKSVVCVPVDASAVTGLQQKSLWRWLAVSR